MFFIITQARERQPYFKKFAHGWAIEEFLKSQLKNRRAYARKNGFLEDIKNLGNQGSDSDSDSPSDLDSDNGMNAGAEEVDEEEVNGSQPEAEAEEEDDIVAFENQS